MILNNVYQIINLLEKWKYSIVVPIYKRDKEDIGNLVLLITLTKYSAGF